MSDAILEGIYFFGGRSQKGELCNKLRFLKPVVQDGKVVNAEWQKIKQQGFPPCGRTGHTMSFLPCNQCLIIAGGRNDQQCNSKVNPFL